MVEAKLDQAAPPKRRFARGLVEGGALTGAVWLGLRAYADGVALPSGPALAGLAALMALLCGLSRLVTGGVLGGIVGAALGGVIGLEMVGRGPAPNFYTGDETRHLGQIARISGPTLDGGSFEISRHKGRVVLVDFWATWCQPCLAEMPDLVRLYHRYHGEGLDVVGVSHDREVAALARYVKDNDIPWPQIIHPEPEKRGGSNPNAVAYDVPGIPYALVVNREGKIVGEGLRGERLRQAVEQALRGRDDGSGEGPRRAMLLLLAGLGWLAGAALQWSFRQPAGPSPAP